uniref:SAP30-binding protein n=1 Tax=Globodera rostochiensis TaxID=31243 RepID=A0A914HPD1_GLORO
MDALVAYGSDSEEEGGELRAERRQQQRGDIGDIQQTAARAEDVPLVEPRPPRRQSDMYDDDDDDAFGSERRVHDDEEEGEEEELDSLLEKGLTVAKYSDSGAIDGGGGGGSTPGPGYTPRSVCSTDEPMEEEEEPENAIHHRDLPPSPPGECDPVLAQRFVAFFEKKERGVDMNANIKRRKDYTNPSLYEALRNAYGIDEKGTNFARALYDPNAFRTDDFYDALGDYQAAQEARRKKMAQQQQEQQQHHHGRRPASFPTAGGATAAEAAKTSAQNVPSLAAVVRRSHLEGK